MKLLHIDSSVTGPESVTRRLGAAVVARFRAEHPTLTVTYRDLAASPLPQQSETVSSNALDALASNVVDVDAARDLRALAAALDEFLAADVVVIGAPMYNFSVPSQLKAWLDALAVAGKTFRYSEKGPEGLAGDKRVVVVSSRGAVYAEGSPFAALDFQEPYLAAFFRFIGVTDLAVVRAEGVRMGDALRDAALSGALAAIERLPVAEARAS